MAAVLGAAGFSIKAIFVKAAFRYGVDAETLLALRMLYSLPLFLLMGLAAARSAEAPISAADWRALALLGVLGYYAASYLDFLGLQYISAALERVILFTYPTIVVMFTAWRERRWPSRSTWSALLLCYAGVALVVTHDLHSGGRGTLIGSAWVFASAVSYAFYLLRAGPLLLRIGSARVAAWGTTIACLLALGQFVVFEPIAHHRGATLAGAEPERRDGGVRDRAAGVAGVRGDAPARSRADGDDRLARTRDHIAVGLGAARGVARCAAIARRCAGGLWRAHRGYRGPGTRSPARRGRQR